MSEKMFIQRLADGDIKELNKSVIDEEYSKIGPVAIEGKGDMSYFLEGLSGADLSNVDVSRIR